MTDDLIAWLNRQIDDDERIARAANPSPWRWRIPGASHLDQNTIFGDGSPRGMDKLRQVCNVEMAWEREANAEHIIRNQPARALREVEAKRKTLAVHRITTYPPYPEGGRPEYSCRRCDWTPEEELHDYGVACEAVLAIASVYSDRPGYRDEWRLT